MAPETNPPAAPGEDLPRPVTDLVAHSKARALEISLRDVRRAIVLDFEGRGWSWKTGTAPPPALLGALVPHGKDPPEYVAYVFEPELKILTRSVRGEWRHARFTTLEAALADVLRRAERGRGRHVTWFSRHEAEEIGPVLERVASLRPLADRCFDAKALMDSANRHLGVPVSDEGQSLAHYAGALGAKHLLAEQEALAVEPATVLRKLQAACAGVRRLANVPHEVRERADDPLEYNRLDCVMTRTCVAEAWRVLFQKRPARRGRGPRTAASQVCEVHGLPLRPGRAEIFYGLPVMGWYDAWVEAERTQFPHANTRRAGGCCITGHDPTHADVLFCPACREGLARWDAEWEALGEGFRGGPPSE